MNFRRISPDDALFVSNIRNEVAFDFLHDSQNFTPEETKKWILKFEPDFWIIELSGEPIGYFRLSNRSEKNKNIYIGADIKKDLRGKGFGFIAYVKFIPMLFEMYNLNKITLEVLSTNNRAISLYKKLGFVTEGVKRQEVLKGEKFIDSIIMSILLSEMENMKNIYQNF